MRELQIASPEDAIVMYHMYNQVKQGADIAKAKMLLEAVRDKEATKYREPFKWAGKDLSLSTIILKVPHIPGRDTPKDDKTPSLMKLHRKALHTNTYKSNVK